MCWIVTSLDNSWSTEKWFVWLFLCFEKKQKNTLSQSHLQRQHYWGMTQYFYKHYIKCLNIWNCTCGTVFKFHATLFPPSTETKYNIIHQTFVISQSNLYANCWNQLIKLYFSLVLSQKKLSPELWLAWHIKLT